MEQQDHDTLIKLKTEVGHVNKSLTSLCGKIDKFMASNKEDHDCIRTEYPKQFLFSKTFYWVAGFLILGLLTIGATTIDNRVSINTNKLTIEAHHDDQLPRPEVTEDAAESSSPRS
jgi:hypothetical protein